VSSLSVNKPLDNDVNLISGAFDLISNIAHNSTDTVTRGIESMLIPVFKEYYKMKIRHLADKYSAKSDICRQLGMTEKVYDELVSEIEEEELYKITEYRILQDTEMISHDDFWESVGVGKDVDLSDIQEDEFE
jgi:hypothetical protein